uniref:Uncharacterized protein n=1 Tax=Megaselia scalaris TaxID=36166 RepID=T1GYY6_MEGSC
MQSTSVDDSPMIKLILINWYTNISKKTFPSLLTPNPDLKSPKITSSYTLEWRNRMEGQSEVFNNSP